MNPDEHNDPNNSSEPTVPAFDPNQPSSNDPAPVAFVSAPEPETVPAQSINLPPQPESPVSHIPMPVAPLAETSSPLGEYTSNPFLNAVRGLVLTLDTNPVAALLTGFIGAIGLVLAYLVGVIVGISGSSPALVAVIGVLAGIWYILSLGAFYSIGAQSAIGQKITTSKAYASSLKKFLPFIALNIIIVLVAFIGTLLLIIPGVIFMARSSLAAIIMFSENVGPITALKRSFKLTKGHVNEMLGAMFAGAFIGESYYSLLFGAVSVSPLVGRYHDLKALEVSGNVKPKTHWLNYLYLLGIVAVALIAGLFAFGIFNGLNSKTTTSTSTTPFNIQPSNSGIYTH